MKKKLLVSACLLGRKCRYDGGGNYAPGIEALAERFELVPVCPEQLGGLPTPRTPSERVGERVLSRDGADLTAAFRQGAERALAIAQEQGVACALLKERSPSCGCGAVYDGTFSGKIIPGSGVAAELLEQNGIPVLGESRMEELNQNPPF